VHMQVAAANFLVQVQHLYESCLLCLIRTSFRDIRHLSATLLYFILASKDGRTWVFKAASAETICHIIMHSLLKNVDDTVSEHQETSMQDCCLAVAG
jgi:hypothetical protein